MKKSILFLAMLIPLVMLSCKEEEDAPNTFTITYYDLCGYVSPPAAITVEEGTVLSASQLPILHCDECDFDGWYYVEGYERRKVYEGQYKLTSNVTLLADWAYELKLDANGGDGNSGTVKINFSANTVKLPTASECGISNNGKTFVCWASSADMTQAVFYLAAESFDRDLLWGQFAFSREKKEQLYAVWTEASDKLKIANLWNGKDVVMNLKDGDTILYLDGGTGGAFSSPITESYKLSDICASISVNDINVDLSYLDNRFAAITPLIKSAVSLKVRGVLEIEYDSNKQKSVYTHSIAHPALGFSFKYLYNLKTVEIIAGCNSIGEEAFRNCTSLEDVSLPETLLSLGPSSFSGCDNLAKVEFGTKTGWVRELEDGTIENLDVSNAENNAKYLRSKKSEENDDSIGKWEKSRIYIKN